MKTYVGVGRSVACAPSGTFFSAKKGGARPIRPPPHIFANTIIVQLMMHSAFKNAPPPKKNKQKKKTGNQWCGNKGFDIKILYFQCPPNILS